MTIVIAGDRSGVGKTTVTLCLLASLHRKKLKVKSFKVGPDYIDPMFHQYVTGVACQNLDPFLTSTTYIKKCFSDNIARADYGLIEGVMGLFDGASGTIIGEKLLTINELPIANFASTAHIALLLDLPVILVLDCSRLSGSVAAIAHGYRSFEPKIKIAGLVLNRVGSDRHLELLKDALLPLQIPIIGVLRRQDNITIPDRHLGLVPTAEISELEQLIDRLAYIGDTCFNWELLLPLMQCNQAEKPIRNIEEFAQPIAKVKIAIARDRAFNFYYQDNLDLLEHLGAELVFWSPLTDSSLPKGIQGLYFGGGFPEVFASELSANITAIKTVRSLIQQGIPTYAECGGLMYLCKQIIHFDEQAYSMVGALPTTAVMSDRLTLGYRQAKVLQNSPLVAAGETVWGHEFHRSCLTEMPAQPLFQISGTAPQPQIIEEGWQMEQIHASYIHLHFGDRPEIPKRFLKYCANYVPQLD